MASNCRLCGSPRLRSVLDLGEMPLANSFLSRDQLATPEPAHPLHLHVCDECLLAQLGHDVSPESIFTEYAYFSSVSSSWVEHARDFALEATRRLELGPNSLVVEVASNDGYLLRHFQNQGIEVLGVEPAVNVASEARASGIPTDVAFFGVKAADRLRRQDRGADLIVANNVLAHVPDLNDFVGGLATLLSRDGVVSIEFPHLLALVAGVQFDTIYHEHYSYFSLRTAERALSAHGLQVFDVELLPTHGGSLRVWARAASDRLEVEDRVDEVRSREAAAGLDSIATYAAFAERVEGCRASLLDFLARARREGERVVGYGAAAKASTLLNYCGVSSADIAYVCDRSPHKQGLFLPGSRIPIVEPSELARTKPHFVIVFAWNIAAEVMEQISDVRDWGGRFVIPVPETKVLG